MKVVSTEALTKLIQLVKSAFVKVEDVVETSEVTLADVALSGDYDDLINKPTIPTVPTNVSAFTNDSGYITNSALAPYALSADLASVATSGSYNDLSNKPTIPTVNNPTITFTQGGVSKGSFTLNQATGDTIALDAGGGSSYIAGAGIDITDDVISVDSFVVTTNRMQTITSQKTFNGKISVKDVSNLTGTTILETYAGNTNVGSSNTTLVFKSNLTRPYFNNTNTQLALLSDVPTDTSDLTNGAGYITGITSGDVTTALGYTPYNASNPSGYITSSALVPYVLSADLANVATSGSYNDLSNKPDLSAKANIDLSNCTKPHIVETYVNGTSWYRVYSDGWCEQGGVSAKNLQTIQLLKAYANTDYIVFGNIITTDAQQVYGNQVNIMTKTTTNFSFPNSSGAQRQWHACGYIS